MAELADALVLGTSTARCVGSNPSGPIARSIENEIGIFGISNNFVWMCW